MSNLTSIRPPAQPADAPPTNRAVGPARLRPAVVVQSTLLAAGRSADPAARRGHGERGQATTEYALVLLAAALVALLVVAWATAGGGAAKIGSLFDRVIDTVTDRI